MVYGGPPPQPAGFPPHPSGPPPRRLPPALPIVVAALALGIVVGVLLAAAGLPLGWYHSPGPAPTMLAAPAPGPDGFGTNFTTGPPPTPDQLRGLRAVTPQSVDRGAVTGTARGLYGGSLENSTCDAAGILGFLQQDPARRGAWLRALNVSESDFESYVTSLTSVVLLNDTWVTNHGYRDGTATPFQSVLQAGTAVLVDQSGVPRVRCACGNPLTEAAPQQADPAGASTPWAGYDDTDVVRVAGGSRLDTISMVDLTSGAVVQRGIGIGRTGQVQASLIWSTDDDLDLHVVDPGGVEIYYNATSSPSGGRLDLDTIPAQGFTSQHIENIFWDTGAPGGTYSTFVRNFHGWGLTASPYQLKVYVGGALVQTQSGALSDGEDGTTITFSVRG